MVSILAMLGAQRTRAQSQFPRHRVQRCDMIHMIPSMCATHVQSSCSSGPVYVDSQTRVPP